MQAKNYELKGSPLLQVKSLERRANCKIVTLSNKKQYLIGGMTADAVSNQIFEFRLNHEHSPPKIQWKQVHFDNDLFSPRNSFSACSANNLIYIWGGLEVNINGQTALSDLIQIDVEKGRMRTVPLKQKIGIHSAALFFDSQTNSLIAYGGSDENSNMPAFLYILSLKETEQYQWQRIKITCSQHQGYIWQHSACLSNHSFFTQEKGKFMTIVGGCKMPQSPYKALVQININKKQVTNSLLLEQSLVSHDCVQRDGHLYIFGGSNGGDFNNFIYVLDKGKTFKLKGHRAIGCCCCLLEDKILVYGGVCGSTSINGAFIYQ